MSNVIKVKYFGDQEALAKSEKGDMIDLRSAVTVSLKKGEYKRIPLGVAMKLPEGMTGIIVPRSSSFENGDLSRSMVWALLITPTAAILTSGNTLFTVQKIQQYTVGTGYVNSGLLILKCVIIRLKEQINSMMITDRALVVRE
jgi:hypothetical protein